MNKTLDSYKKVVGEETLNRIRDKANKLNGKHIINISSTYQGGGVAEILNSIIFLFNDMGIQVGWRILHGNQDFFSITKKFHNALQGGEINLSRTKKEIYYEVNRQYSVYTHIVHDLVVVHDPQPAAIIDFYKKKQPWIFRCHVDLSMPNKKIWSYLKKFISKYDHIVVSKDNYMRDLPLSQSVIYPAIDPISAKNKKLQQRVIDKIMDKYGIRQNKPIISQISRFDKWKDPEGVIRVFESVRRRKNCQLVLLGSFATDDPEGIRIFEKVKKRVASSAYKNDISVLAVDDVILVNCLQRVSSVVIQKSLREGFGLTVAEALYKGTPVVSSCVGGIPLQVQDGVSGYLCRPKDTRQFADKILYLLDNEDERQKMGEVGAEYITKNFLITRLIEDWLDLYAKYLKA